MTAGQMRLLNGWGRTAASSAAVIRPGSSAAVAHAFQNAGPRGVLPRGLGRSYGDVAQNAGGTVLDMTGMGGIVALDVTAGTLTAMAGESLDSVLRAVVPQGWFLPVTPGTRFVTLGGAIANDVHGKNHHVEGSLGHHLLAFDLVTPAGSELTVTPENDPALFAATLGGMGLTGVITQATIRLLPITTSRIRQDTDRCAGIDDLMAKMTSGDAGYRYSVAWIDCLSRGAALGRAVLTRGDHADPGELPHPHQLAPLRYGPRALPSVPAGMPDIASALTARAFNELWFRKALSQERGRIVPITSFFYPLDVVGDWNRIYGRRGFVQYQFVVPFAGDGVIRGTLDRLARARCPSFLAVLKRFGPGRGMLSFPMEGWTLAMDIPAGDPGVAELLDSVDREVAEAGGRVYLAKDSRLDPAMVPAMYPDLDRWLEVRECVDPQQLLRSDMSRRLNLDRSSAGVSV
ncbi:MAG: FAD-binding oxidoreductase [Actinomycetota bacterium]